MYCAHRIQQPILKLRFLNVLGSMIALDKKTKKKNLFKKFVKGQIRSFRIGCWIRWAQYTIKAMNNLPCKLTRDQLLHKLKMGSSADVEQFCTKNNKTPSRQKWTEQWHLHVPYWFLQLVVNGCCIEQQKWSKIRTIVYEKVIDLVEFPYTEPSTGEIIFAFSNSTFGGAYSMVPNKRGVQITV